MTATALLTRPAAQLHAGAHPDLHALPSLPAVPAAADTLRSRWSARPATVEELVARDIEAFTQRRRRAAS